MQVNQVADPVVEIADIGLIGIFVNAVLAAIQLLRVIALPPLALAVVEREVAIVRHAGQRTGPVAQMGNLKPPPIARRVNGHAEAESLIARRRRPIADDVPARTDVLRVPSVMF